jgi:putative DNA modification/repair radical SAM protein
VLYSNMCRYDCAYCANRVSADIPRTSFTIDELVTLTCEFYRRNYIEGLFLSSGIFSDPDIVMRKLIETAKRLRTQAGYGGYIHLKIIPGSGENLIREAGLWADRLSANIELPTEKSLQTLAPQKSGKLIFGAMGQVLEAAAETGEDRRRLRHVPVFAPAGQSTQLVIGASAENDRTIMGLSSTLYRKYELRRVYYSAYVPVGKLPPAGQGNLFLREHRLYQADWLLRFYHYQVPELFDQEPNLDRTVDPKLAWALRHLNFFPLELKTASYEELLRVPGLGVRSARRIIEIRRSQSLGFTGLSRLGVLLKRARYFVTLGGRFAGPPPPLDNPAAMAGILGTEKADPQLPLFDSVRGVHTQEPVNAGEPWGGTKGMDPESNTFKEQHTPPNRRFELRAKLDPQVKT